MKMIFSSKQNICICFLVLIVFFQSYAILNLYSRLDDLSSYTDNAHSQVWNLEDKVERLESDVKNLENRIYSIEFDTIYK